MIASARATEQAAGKPLPRMRSALLLALAAPAIAELLSTSAPPAEFFVPWVFCLFVAFYGGSAVTIRELAIRWGKGWPTILLLGAAFGILQEGLATRAFFDPAWRSLGPIAGQGRALGVNWIWTCDAILYHAVFSTALPILLVYQVFPAARQARWLRRGELAAWAGIFALGAAVFLYSGKDRYQPQPVLLAGCVAAIGVFCVLARKAPSAAPFTSAPGKVAPGGLALVSFLCTLGLVLQIYLVPLAHSAGLTAAFLAALMTGAGYALGRVLRGEEGGLVAGALGAFGMVGLFRGLNPSGPATALALVGVSSVVLAVYFWKHAQAGEAEPRALGAAPRPTMAAAAGASGGAGLFAGAGTAVAFERPLPEAHPASQPSVAWRAFEICVAAVALLVSSPIILALAIIVRRGTPGPALFWQERLGIGRKPFRFVKFRTLHNDARQRFPELYAYRYSSEDLRNLKFKLVNDPRVTPQGRWMRKSTLDELPNFWNVLRGEMALVGPRPEIPEMLPYYTGEMLLKFSVRPGLTGLAQIAGRGHLDFHETVRLDVEYVKRRSPVLDLKIMVMTVYKAITQEGAF
ncbi:MAG TPA: sugar transferase [Bryobacteraceae bacterium]|nr:sugar transferase [Bryobacteraceae bacterium]